MIPAETIEEIKNKADIVSIISSYVPLKKKGRNYLGLCPFHQEKTPSFTVSPEKDLWHCFGCGVGGNVLSFVMKIENLSFVESIKLLGERVGIAVRDEMTGNYQVKKEKKDLLYALCLKASEFFKAQLRSERGERARGYLKERSLSEEIIEKFKIGYVPEEWDSILNYLVQAGYSPDLLEQAGLVISREDKSGYYDRFRGRLIFTVTDTRGRPVAFGGRILAGQESKQEPKYLNSPETVIFSKGKLLYAFPEAQAKLRETKTAILTEGYLDTLTCHQNGFENTVATLGTALTLDQAKLLARYVQTIILAYDADQAGQLATERGIVILKEAGLDIKVASLKGKDPDEMLRKEGSDAFNQVLKEAVPYIRYLLDRSIKNFNIREPEGKNKAAEAAVKILQSVDQEVLRSEYIRYVAEVLKIKEEVLLAALQKGRYYKKKTRLSPTTWVRPTSKQNRAEEIILRAALESLEIREKILAEVEIEDVAGEKNRDLLKEIEQNRAEQGYAWLGNIKNEPVQKLARSLLLQEEPWAEKIVLDCIKVLKDARNQQKQALLRQELQEAEASGDAERARELLATLQSKKI